MNIVGWIIIYLVIGVLFAVVQDVVEKEWPNVAWTTSAHNVDVNSTWTVCSCIIWPIMLPIAIIQVLCKVSTALLTEKIEKYLDNHNKG